MTGCDKCKDLNVEYHIQHPSELRQALSIAKQNVADNTIYVVEDECNQSGHSFSELSDSGQWEDDLVHYVFKCNACGQKFVLVAETFHGAGGRWKPI